jgi:hydroxypyruvate isomerase
MKFSANLGFLWRELALPDAIRAAKAAGFDAVECHWPYATPAAEVSRALAETGLPMLGLNTVRGDPAAKEFGLSALPGREDEARAAIDQAVAYGAEIGARNVHVMAGVAQGPEAEAVFLNALEYACACAAPQGMTILIEPLNPYDAPGYFLGTTGHAQRMIEAVNRPNLRLMFDCYHVQRTEGDVVRRLRDLLPLIGHIQFASTPDRGAPDHGTLDYTAVFQRIEALGWAHPLGAEYLVSGDTEATLHWLSRDWTG